MNSVELSQELTIAPYSAPVSTAIAKDEDKHLFRTVTSFRLYKNVLENGTNTYQVHCSHDESKFPLMLNNQNPTSITIKRGILGYTLLDCTQETTQVMSVIENVAFIEFLEASDPEMNNDLHLYSTESYIYSLPKLTPGTNFPE